jgi:hypothetical protein
MNFTLITAIVGVACGITGLVLGIINTWHQLRRDKIRLKVVPQFCFILQGTYKSDYNFSIDVINLSEFPLVIEDLGFQMRDGKKCTYGVVSGIERGGNLPVRLEPRTSYSKILKINENDLDFHNIKCAYARTQCGAVIFGSSPALKQVIKKRFNLE